MNDFEAVSADSQKYLDQAKKGKSRNFLLVTSGVKVVALLVKRKPIKPAEVKELKSAAKGKKTFVGVLEGAGQKISFKLEGDETKDTPPTKELILKDFLLSKADFKCKPKYEFIQDVKPVDDDDTDPDTENEQEVETDPSAKAIADALKDLEPDLKQFVSRLPDRRVEILKPWKVMKDFDEGQEVSGEAALEALDKVKELIDELKKLPRQEELKNEQKAPGQDMRDFIDRLAKLKPDIDEIVKANVPVSEDLKLGASQAGMLARKSEFEAADTMLERIMGMIERGKKEIEQGIPAAPKGAPPLERQDSSASEFKWRSKELAPKVKEVVTKQLEGFAQLGKLFKEAQGLKESDPLKAVELLRECSKLAEAAYKAERQAQVEEEEAENAIEDLEELWKKRIETYGLDMKRLREGEADKLADVDLKAIENLHKKAVKAASKGDYERANDLHDEVEVAIASAQGKLRASEAFDKIPKGAVPFLSALHEWQQAGYDVQQAVEAVQKKIVEVAPEHKDSVAAQLDEILARFGFQLDDLLQQCIDAPDEVSRKRAHSQTLKLIGSFLKDAKTDALVTKIDEFPLEKVDVKKTLTSSLGSISKQLGVSV